jgi:transcriptional regulator with XRE-family HTH domain
VAESSPIVRRRRLGLALQQLRKQAGLTGQDVAQRVERSASWVSRVETGKVGLRVRELRDLLDAYAVTNLQERLELEQLAREGKGRGWWSAFREAIPNSYDTYIGLEDAAREIFAYDHLAVPGLLQTEEYARAIHELAFPPLPPRLVEDRLRVRQLRQQILTRDEPTKLSVILEEAVVYRVYGRSDALRNQLAHLLELGDQSNIDIRIAPLRRVYRFLTEGLTVLRFQDEPTAVYLETATSASIVRGADVEIYLEYAKRIQEASLDTEDSYALIRDVVQQMRG